MASTTSASLLPKSVVPAFPCPPTIFVSATHLTNASLFNVVALPDQLYHAHRPCFRQHATKKNGWLDPFDFGDDPEMEYGSMFSEGKQDEDPRPPDNPDNPYGFLKFPMGYSVEIASLGLKIRGDVRRCCCVISGGVYENLLFFPTIQLIKARYPGVQVDVLASPRGKQAYELNKNVRWADAYDPDEDFPEPMLYTDMIGILKVSDFVFAALVILILHLTFVKSLHCLVLPRRIDTMI